jgi:hypothetical protein
LLNSTFRGWQVFLNSRTLTIYVNLRRCLKASWTDKRSSWSVLLEALAKKQWVRSCCR